MISLIVGLVFIICGYILRRYPPENINGIYGYRTPMSMKNKDTWMFAQKCGGNSMSVLGSVNIILWLWSFICPLSVNNETAQLLFLLAGSVVMIGYVEYRLREIFNKDGSRKS